MLRPATEDGVFFVGDSAGHCLATTAEGIRTAIYFGLAAGRELAAVIEGSQTREQALVRYHDFSDDHAWQFKWMWRVQSLFSWANKLPLMDTILDAIDRQRFVDWSFRHYLNIAHPSFVLQPNPQALASG
jgi:flavin-dependent dehydrogenase